jgi:hypothetical protein
VAGTESYILTQKHFHAYFGTWWTPEKQTICRLTEQLEEEGWIWLLTFWTLPIILLQMEAESSFRSIVLNKNRVMDNVQKVSNCTDISLSQTFRSYEGWMLEKNVLVVQMSVPQRTKKLWEKQGCCTWPDQQEELWYSWKFYMISEKFVVMYAHFLQDRCDAQTWQM